MRTVETWSSISPLGTALQGMFITVCYIVPSFCRFKLTLILQKIVAGLPFIDMVNFSEEKCEEILMSIRNKLNSFAGELLRKSKVS